MFIIFFLFLFDHIEMSSFKLNTIIFSIDILLICYFINIIFNFRRLFCLFWIFKCSVHKKCIDCRHFKYFLKQYELATVSLGDHRVIDGTFCFDYVLNLNTVLTFSSFLFWENCWSIIGLFRGR